MQCSVTSDSVWPYWLEPTSSSVHGILQARILEWIAISFSRGSSQSKDSWRRTWQGWNLGLLHCRQIPYHLSRQGSLPDKHASSSQKSYHSLLAFLISKPWSTNCLQTESQNNCKTHLVSVLLRIMAERKPILTPCWKLFLWLAFIIIIIVNGLPRRPCPSLWL